MASVVRTILAGVAGVLAAFVTVATVEAIAHAVVPRGAMPAAGDRAAVAAYIASMPTGAFLSIASAWCMAVLTGAWVARTIAGGQRRGHALLVGGVIALSAVMNFVLVPHPPWFMALGPGAVAAATLLAMRGRARADVATP